MSQANCLSPAGVYSMNNSVFRNIQQIVTFDEHKVKSDEDSEQEFQEERRGELVKQTFLNELETTGTQVLAYICDPQFMAKYGLDFNHPQIIHSYMFTQQPREYTYVFEAFASVHKVATDRLQRRKEEMIFHPMFEDVIERFTKSRSKPNPVLVSTRSSEFCYRLVIVTEAVPPMVQESIGSYFSSLRLFREFEILSYVWNKYCPGVQAKPGDPDQMVGIPMPFEFVNVVDTEYDFDTSSSSAVYYYNIYGAFVPVNRTRLPDNGGPLRSFLSYMSIEKLGPSLSYMADLLKSQKSMFNVSTALKVLDQLICRLMVFHRVGVILGNLDPRFLNLGVREATNVLYVNNFDCAVVAPTKGKPIQNYNERFVSLGVIKDSCHFVNDIESAFYIFLSMLMPWLPWDDREAATDHQLQRDGSWSPGLKNYSMKRHHDERIKLWDTGSYLSRYLNQYPIHLENSSPNYRMFATDIIHSVYLKTKEAVSTCSGISQFDFMANVFTPNTVAYNAYYNIRKVIVSYFRFESLNNSLRDTACQVLVDRLIESESKDIRVLFDLNEWCWNVFETSFLSRRSSFQKGHS